MNPQFGDLGHQVEFVKQALGMGDPGKKMFNEGNGWDGHYELYCNKCNVEVLRPYIAENDMKRLKRCPKCQTLNELFTREERRQQLQSHMDQLLEEETAMKARRKKCKKFRKKRSAEQQFAEMQLGHTDDDDDDDAKKDNSRNNIVSLTYKEHEMWTSTVDLDSYLDDEFYVPRSIKEVTDRAWDLHAKYAVCQKQMDLAVAAKQRGNEALKAGNFTRATEHYKASICARTDYKPSYNNLALAYIKRKQYRAAIVACDWCIAFIEHVDEHQRDDDVCFKAHLRRATAYKLLEQYEAARTDIDAALRIKPNDGAAKKLRKDIKLLHKRATLRAKLAAQCTSDANLNDFESVFNLSVEFLTEATQTEEEFHFETGHSEELLRRLLIFLAKEKKYCVRFADHNGVELSLKYLRQKFRIIKQWKEKLPTLEKPFLLLNYCCEKDVNFDALKEQKLQKLIGVVSLFTFGYFGDMPKELQSFAMRFVAVVCSIDHIRAFIAQKHGERLLAYFVRFQKKTNPTEQDAKAIRSVFEALSYLCMVRSFQTLLVRQTEPYLYQVLLHSMKVYQESSSSKYVARSTRMSEDERKALMNYEQLQFAISVCLDGLALVFDGARDGGTDSGGNSQQQQQQSPQQNDADDDSQKHQTAMIAHFVANQNIDSYMQLLSHYLHSVTKKFREFNNRNKDEEKANDDDQNEKDCRRYFGQLCKCLSVFVALSRDAQTHDVLFRYSMQKDLISVMRVVKNPFRHRYAKLVPMLKICRNNVLMYLDHISTHRQFDAVFSRDFDRDVENASASSSKLPFFWTFIGDVLVEEYKEHPRPQLMQQFAHYKACVIRLLYRWLCRRVDGTKPLSQQNKAQVASAAEREQYKATYVGDKKVSYILEGMLQKYLVEILEWLKYNDLQVVANTPLVVRQFMLYAINMSTERPHVKRAVKNALTVARLQDIKRLMAAPHQVVQYNACLLMSTCQEFDDEMTATVKTIGADEILKGFQRMQMQQQEMRQKSQNQKPAIGL